MMQSMRRSRLLAPFTLMLCWVLAFPPAAFGFFGSLTIEKEKQIGEEFCLQLQQYYPVVRDPFLASYINAVGQKLVQQLGSQPFQFRFFIIEDPSYNAFAVPGGYVFVNTGLIRIMEREDELAGVLAHEITHIHQRHMAKRMDKAKFGNIAALVGGLAAVLLGGAAAAPILAGTMAGAETAMLKYSRDDEREADTLGFKWATKAGYDPRYMMSVFRKMARQRWFEGSDIPVYLKTHPELESRIVDLSHLYATYELNHQERPINPAFTYFRQRMEALYGNPQRMKRELLIRLSHEPDNVPYRYSLALIYKRLGDRSKAAEAYQQALNRDPYNDMIKRDLAIFYYESNRPQEAQTLFKELLQRNSRDEVSLYYLGLILQDRRQVDEALPLFEKLHGINPAFTEVYYNLGALYGEKQRLGPAHYYLGLHSRMAKDLPTALFHFRKALTYLGAQEKYHDEAQAEVFRLERMRVRVSN
ncbi:M48 family metallopeptidase [Desulfobacca acetoxidans]|uniref:Peptidase M48 Ste24p n=1 Tax=Desulfobacca acetoxidans (strain ATCC 700848 / DSM 11109 / ASRB2) TaxID=880072 RepID=F2NHP3_DESAR|nr:M48 family metallopeptidase [Desulfobacca acetoxidans]AEB09230.1 peptidase M48 Ste24p [Desulfobacca acetoxidans DSM 11109]